MNPPNYESVKEKFLRLNLVLVAGNYGAGKTEFAVKHHKDAGFMHVNRKEIRKSLFEMLHFGQKWENRYYEAKLEMLVKHTERKILEQLLAQGHKVVVDNTSMDRDSRKRYLDVAKAAHVSAGIVFIDRDVQDCLKRNRQTPDPVEDVVISGLFAHKQLPARDEGFAEVLVIKDI